MNNSKASIIVELGNEIVDCAKSLQSVLEDIMMSCSGILPGVADDITQLHEATKKILRVQNFIDSFQKYVSGIRALEFELYIKLNAMANAVDVSNPNEAWEKEVELIKTLMADLEERGITLEQYRAALLDTFMYLDMFNSDVNNDYDAGKVIAQLEDGMTINEVLDVLSEYSIYTDREHVVDSTRYIYYNILRDAIERDPMLGRFEVSHMSRIMKKKNTMIEWNEGTNGIVFTEPFSDTIYVAYRGTSKGEWGDDGERFNCKSMDDLTPQMVQTLDYFAYVAEKMNWTEDMTIYVTGHSQGGNDSQISILLSPYGKYVDACYSFDGEGHSPELLVDVEKRYGTEEYQNRISRMYSICGEYDFVNHLGEKVIREENTIYVKCNFDTLDVARAHDIVSMFCDTEMNYNGMINTTKGAEPSWVTKYTAKVWEELYEMPDSMRASCQAALMNLAEMGLSKLECTQGLNGEHATMLDYAVFLKYGLDTIGDSATKVVLQSLKEKMIDGYAYQLVDKATENGILPERIADEVKEEVDDLAQLYLENYELKTDKEKLSEYVKYTNLSIPYLAWKQEDTSWEYGYLYKAGEKYMDYMVNRYEDVKEDVQEVIALGETGWNMLQDVTVTLGKAVYENREAILETTKQIWEMTRPRPIMPIGLTQ